jgi:hypothetical protein
MAKSQPHPKTLPHPVLKRIKYRSKLDGQRYIDPGQEEVTFEHLADEDYALLRKKNIIGEPGTAAPAKAES